MMAELVEAGEAGRDLDAEPLQLQLHRVPGGLCVDASCFSRLRQRLSTSETVMG